MGLVWEIGKQPVGGRILIQGLLQGNLLEVSYLDELHLVAFVKLYGIRIRMLTFFSPRQSYFRK